MLELRRSRDRGYDDHGWLKTYYTFSFADYYDPEHVAKVCARLAAKDAALAGMAACMAAIDA